MSKANARYRRSIIIGIVALGSLVWVSTEQYGVPRENIAWMLIYTLAGVFSVIVFAAVVVGLLVALRKLKGAGRE
jgi:hypothetical protein